MSDNEIRLPIKGGEGVFIINEVNPFRTQALLNRVAKLLNYNDLITLMSVAQDDAAPLSEKLGAAVPGILGVLKNADDETLEKLCALVLYNSACKYRIEGIKGWEDLNDASHVSKLFTGKMVSMYKLIAFSLKVNFRPFVDELKGLPSSKPEVSSDPKPSP